MFSKKPESFKYEVEVNALIREATTGLNQRVVALEVQNNHLVLQNQKLEYELNALRHTVYADVQRLEKRITDFTDVWHPIMSENMNRIKAELETTIREAEREDIQKISFELENKLTKIVEDKEEFVVIGRLGSWSQPIIIQKNMDFIEYGGFSNWIQRQGINCLYFEQLKKLTNIKQIEISQFEGVSFVTKGNSEAYEGGGIMNGIIRGTYDKKLNQSKIDVIRALLELCDLKGIKLLHGGKEYNQFGISIRQLLEQRITL